MTASQPPKSTKLPAVSVGLDRLIEAADRLAASEENAFLCAWLPTLAPDAMPPSLSVRYALALRTTGKLDEARQLLASLPRAPAGWGARDVARVEHERAWFALVDHQRDAARAHVTRGLQAIVGDARVGATPELVDLYIAEARIESASSEWDAAQRSLDHAAHVAERLPPGPWRVQLEVNIGYLRLRLGRPADAHEAFLKAQEIAPPASRSGLSAHSGDAIALCITGRFDEARQTALEGVEIAGKIGVRWRLADMWDTLGLVEFVADRPHAALRAFDEALAVLGAETQDTLRFAILMHRTTTLAVLGRTRAAEQARSLAETVRQRMGTLDKTYEIAWAVSQARLAEARGDWAEVRRLIAPVLDDSRHYGAGDALLAYARAWLAEGKLDEARTHAEKGCLLGADADLVYGERKHNLAVWALALTSRDSRAVRFADAMLKRLVGERALPALSEMPPPFQVAIQKWQSSSGARPVWLTTRFGVARVPMEEARAECTRVVLSVDLVSHEVRIADKTVALTRHRALEPLLVQMLRRAEEGLSAEDILMAAGGPGPGSADADHRVRVLVSRLRALLGPDAPIVTARAAGEGARAHYRLAPQVEFALIEPGESRDERISLTPGTAS
jgi:tetratricopeptide (TPR) repeat protein